MNELDQDQLVSLKVLGFLYLRLGFFDRASRLFRALFSLSPGDAEVARNLAASVLEAGHPEEALDILDAPPLRAGPEVSAADPVLLLLKARALWRLDKNAEAQGVMDAYLAAAGSQA
jgi:Flp pilus assembly protein TadD